jgi:hypothetical protein
VTRDPFTTSEGRTLPAGSVVFLAAQPYRPFLIEMMERQRYPEVRQGPDTREIFKPYDVTAWTLPLLMGVDWMRVDQPFEAAWEESFALPWTDGGPIAASDWIAIPATSNQSFTLINRLLAKGVRVDRALAPIDAPGAHGERPLRAGAFLVPGRAAETVRKLAAELRVSAVGLDRMPAVPRAVLQSPRVGMYKPWAASMDEGWTRLVLDRHDFAHKSLDNGAMARRNLHAGLDVIVLPDIEKNVIVEGKPKSEDGPTYFEPLPPPYAGGIGKAGIEGLRAFVEQGGTLVCLGSSSALAIEELNLPVRDLVAKARSAEFSVPGTLVRLAIDSGHPLGFGMPEDATAYVTGGPVLSTAIPGAGVGRAVVARYAPYADQVVASGWALGADRMAGKAAVVEAALGKGRVVLIGPRVQHRAQTVGTYKLLFNAIYRGVME